MPGIYSISFDLVDSSLVEQSSNHRMWMNSQRVAHMLRFNHGPLDWPFGLSDPDAARWFYHRQCEDNGGVMLSADVVQAAGAEALWGVFKYRIPVQDSTGMYYVTILWIPFQQCRFQLNIEAAELGTTGVRECAVMVMLGDKWPMPPQKEIPHIESEEQLRELYRSAPVRQLPSDEPEYDGAFPQHPLSMVRARMARVLETVRLDGDARRLSPYRIRR